MRKFLCWMVSLLLLLSSFAGYGTFVSAASADATAGQAVSSGEVPSSTDSENISYEEYRQMYAEAEYPAETAAADVKNAVDAAGKPLSVEKGHTAAGEAALVKEQTPSTFVVSVPKTGWYQLALCYEVTTERATDIQLTLQIDGRLPFTEAEGFSLSQLWEERYPEGADAADDSIRPSLVAVSGSQTVMLSAHANYSNDDSYFYFTAGQHTVTLTGDRGDFWVGSLLLCQPQTPKSYADYLKGLAAKGIVPSALDASPIRLEGEAATLRSQSSLKSIADYSSCVTSPYDIHKDLLNTVGGENWFGRGQWLEWNFTIETAGFYRVFFRYKQNYKAGTYVARRLYLDGETPFAEASCVQFSYNLDWQVSSLGDEEPMYLYLEPGAHALRLEVTYGQMDTILVEVQDCVDALNSLYRNVMMITGISPDSQRDYDLTSALPQAQSQCAELGQRLYAVIDALVAQTGSKGSETAVLEKMALQLTELGRDIELLPTRLDAFNSNISSLASWLSTATQQPLLLDFIQLASMDGDAPVANAVWYRALWNEVQRFFVSFFEDYDSISTEESSDEEPITIWLGVGRDQALVVNQLIRNGFTAETGIPVNLRLISMTSLMPAVASNAGPDVAMYQDQSTVINYALRNAIYDLNQWEDIDEVRSRFYDQSLRCYELGDALYGLPESISCYVLYYRKDILKELNLSVPNTWEELYQAITVLEKNNLEFGIPSSFTTATTTTVSPVFLSYLYQKGGQVYDSTGSQCILNNGVGVQAFNEFCELYTKYGVSLKIDLLTRFRTGQSPLLMNAFSFSNELAVSAPEINGLWDIALLPGTQKEDGTLDRSTGVTNTGAVMFSNARNKENAWEFLKWWTRADAQQSYARAIESALGQSGRWNSANIEALSNSAWSTKELSVIQAQLAVSKALPEVAGGYYTGRSINNAIRTVVSSYEEPKETLYEYVKEINDELRQKRRELGLD